MISHFCKHQAKTPYNATYSVHETFMCYAVMLSMFSKLCLLTKLSILNWPCLQMKVLYPSNTPKDQKQGKYQHLSSECKQMRNDASLTMFIVFN